MLGVWGQYHRSHVSGVSSGFRVSSWLGENLFEPRCGRFLFDDKCFRPWGDSHEIGSNKFSPYQLGTPTLGCDLDLIRPFGSVVVESVRGGSIFVDGQQQGAAPAVLDGVSAGAHTIEVRLGDETWRQSVTVVAGQQIKVTPTFGRR